jgi:MHS family shikimate/dehydroshikimate transporter-like MFS transporter
MAMTPPTQDSGHLRRVAVSSYLGTTIEYYDFLLYGTLAALVFNKVFFTDLSPLVGTIVALATLAAGYVARLGGAILFGHFGDRLGRKSVMLTTMIVMGLSSGLIGLLPTYTQVGAAAPLLLLLLRLLQGLAVGGEYGGAVLMTAEHAGTGRRGLSSSAAAVGAPSGALLATGSVTLLSLLPGDELLAWGWRVPFLASFALLAVGLYFRARIEESPVFLADRPANTRERAPILELIRRSPGRMLHAVLVQVGPYFGQGVFGIFIIAYATSIGYPRSAPLAATTLGLAGSIVMTPVYAALSDRIGRRPLLIFAGTGLAVTAYPVFLAINSTSTALLILGVAGYLTFVMTAATAVAPVLLSELFPTGIRYTSVSASYQLAQTIGSGFGPLIGASLLAAAGGGTRTGVLAAFLVAIGLISATAARFLPETHTQSLTTVAVEKAQRPAIETPPARGGTV